MKTQGSLVDSAMAVVGWLLCVAQATAQMPLADPQLELRGPSGQTAIVAVRYFDGLQAVETQISRSELSPKTEAERLAFGHAGIYIKALVATSQPVKLRLLDGEREVASVVSNQPGSVELRYGQVPADDLLELPRGLPDDSEKRLITQWLAAIPKADTRRLVSDSAVANIDWQTLDAYCAALTRELGQPKASQPALDGWMSWEGSLGARVLAGPVEFEQGQCQFKLMTVNEKIVDVEPWSRQMPIHWYDQPPAAIDEYIERAHALLRALVAADIQAAHRLFSRRYDDEVTPELLSRLSQQWRDDYGQTITQLSYKGSDFGDAAQGSTAKRLSVDSVVEFEGGARCMARVDFTIPVGQNAIARAHLSAVNLRPSWQSVAPGLTSTLTASLQCIGAEPTSAAAESLQSLLHPQVQALLPTGALERFLNAAAERIGKLQTPPDYDLWQASTGEQTSAIGPARFDDCPQVMVQANYVGGKLLGLTLVADNYAASTLDLISEHRQTVDLGKRFWTQVLNAEVAVAHAMLAPGFQAQLPVTDMKKLLANAGLDQRAALMSVESDVLRIADRDARALPVMLIGYYNCHFVDGSQVCFSCEFTIPTEDRGAPAITNFETAHSASFPIASQALADKFTKAFLDGDVDAVVALTPPETAADIDPAILQAFMAGLQAERDSQPLPATGESPPPTRLMREYTGGRQLLRIHASLPTANGDIPVQALFEFDKLQSFQFEEPKLNRFVEQLDTAGIERQIAGLVRSWLVEDNQELPGYFVASLRKPGTWSRMKSVRNEWLSTLGEFESHEVLASERLLETNQIRFEIELRFGMGIRRVRITFDINAFTARISGIDFPS